THTLILCQPSCLAASSRRAPQSRVPSGLIVIGCNSPWSRIELISSSRSPRSRRWRRPTRTVPIGRSNSMCPSRLPTQFTRPAGSRRGGGGHEVVVCEQIREGVADQQPGQHPVAERASGGRVAEGELKQLDPRLVRQIELGSQGLVTPQVL